MDTAGDSATALTRGESPVRLTSPVDSAVNLLPLLLGVTQARRAAEHLMGRSIGIAQRPRAAGAGDWK
jgi:hypothetical protein